MEELDKDYLLNDSRTFCMLPWLHIHTNTLGKIYPCSVSKGKEIADIHETSLRESFNSFEMKQLRLDMLKNKYNPLCSACHNHEALYNNGSFRMLNNEIYGKYFDDLVLKTQDNGSLFDFRMYYADLRFDNTCNFKCRTCNSTDSSQWEREDIEHKGIKITRNYSMTNNISLLDEAIEHIPFMKEIYFTGGEPTITEEHYKLLEEMIKKNKTDIIIKYNTNCSTLEFKDKSLLELWKYFPNIKVNCSFDHFGTKAQYIRRGTLWPEIEENYMKIKNMPNVEARIVLMLSVFNYLTLPEFLTHLLLKNMLKPDDPTLYINKIDTPKIYSPNILPKELKDVAKKKILEFIPKLNSSSFWMFPERQILEITDSIEKTEAEDLWDVYKVKFQSEIQRLDRIRIENFIETFPELESMMDDAPRQKPPVV